MNFFKSIKIMWLQHRVYKYTLKSNDYLSKSEAFENLHNRYIMLFEEYFSLCSSDYYNYSNSARKAEIKCKHYLNLHNIYLDKQSKTERILNSLLGINVVGFRKAK